VTVQGQITDTYKAMLKFEYRKHAVCLNDFIKISRVTTLQKRNVETPLPLVCDGLSQNVSNCVLWSIEKAFEGRVGRRYWQRMFDHNLVERVGPCVCYGGRYSSATKQRIVVST